jgi:AcrR family transcriptional regulator
MSGIDRRRKANLERGDAAYLERRQQIAHVATQLFNEKGFRATSIAGVAEAMGIDRGSIYYYISSKEELFDEVVRDATEANVARAEEIRAMDIPAHQKLRLMITELMTSYETHYPLLYIYIREDLRDVRDERATWARYMRSLNRRYDKAMTGIIEDGYQDGTLRDVGPPEIVAFGIIGMMSWTSRWYEPSKPRHDMSDIRATFADLVLKGLEQSPPARRARKPRNTDSKPVRVQRESS